MILYNFVFDQDKTQNKKFHHFDVNVITALLFFSSIIKKGKFILTSNIDIHYNELLYLEVK